MVITRCPAVVSELVAELVPELVQELMPVLVMRWFLHSAGQEPSKDHFKVL